MTTRPSSAIFQMTQILDAAGLNHLRIRKQDSLDGCFMGKRFCAVAKADQEVLVSAQVLADLGEEAQYQPVCMTYGRARLYLVKGDLAERLQALASGERRTLARSDRERKVQERRTLAAQFIMALTTGAPDPAEFEIN